MSDESTHLCQSLDHRRGFDAVVVWRFDGFAHSVSHLHRAPETFRALGIEFVSLSEQVDTSTRTGKMVFTALDAVDELERSLIAERVRAGLRNAKAKGKKLGHPRVAVDASRIAFLRATGASWPKIGEELGEFSESVSPCLIYALRGGGGPPARGKAKDFRSSPLPTFRAALEARERVRKTLPRTVCLVPVLSRAPFPALRGSGKKWF